MATAWKALATITLGASQTGVTFSSIPNSYRDLVVIVSGNTASSDYALNMRLNSDSSSVYSSVSIEANGASTSSTSNTTTSMPTWNYNTFSASTVSSYIAHILDYSATDKHKTVIFRQGAASLGSATALGRYASTSAVSTVYVYAATGNQLAAGTIVSLYGVSA